jgi:hypothetical protein
MSSSALGHARLPGIVKERSKETKRTNPQNKKQKEQKLFCPLANIKMKFLKLEGKIGCCWEISIRWIILIFILIKIDGPS